MKMFDPDGQITRPDDSNRLSGVALDRATTRLAEALRPEDSPVAHAAYETLAARLGNGALTARGARGKISMARSLRAAADHLGCDLLTQDADEIIGMLNEYRVANGVSAGSVASVFSLLRELHRGACQPDPGDLLGPALDALDAQWREEDIERIQAMPDGIRPDVEPLRRSRGVVSLEDVRAYRPNGLAERRDRNFLLLQGETGIDTLPLLRIKAAEFVPGDPARLRFIDQTGTVRRARERPLTRLAEAVVRDQIALVTDPALQHANGSDHLFQGLTSNGRWRGSALSSGSISHLIKELVRHAGRATLARQAYHPDVPDASAIARIDAFADAVSPSSGVKGLMVDALMAGVEVPAITHWFELDYDSRVTLWRNRLIEMGQIQRKGRF